MEVSPFPWRLNTASGNRTIRVLFSLQNRQKRADPRGCLTGIVDMDKIRLAVDSAVERGVVGKAVGGFFYCQENRPKVRKFGFGCLAPYIPPHDWREA